MASKKEQATYKSFEQLRSELFPKLVNQEIIEKTKQNSKQFGNSLANKAIEQILAASEH